MTIYQRSFAGPLLHILDFERFPPSVERLPAALTINGITVNPTLRYKGGDANAVNWPAWGYGETLSLQAGTAPTYNNGSPLLGQMDDSVKFNDGGYYLASGSTGQITTEDIVAHLIIKKGGNSKVIFGKYSGTGTGWVVWVSTLYIYFTLVPAGNVSIITAALTDDAIYDCWLFADRSGYGQWYVNGIASGAAVDISGAAASITTASTLTIGARGDASIPYDSNIYLAELYQSNSWLNTHLQATVAQTRFAQLTGIYPQQARGTALPTSMARTTAGYLDKIEVDGTTKLYYMGANWPRSCSRKDSGSITRKGYLSEASATNSCLQSQTFATTWGTTRSTVPTTSVLCPNGITLTTSTLKEDGTAGLDHFIYQQITLTAVQWVFSCYIKAVNRSWAQLRVGDTLLTAYFNLSGSGAVGTIAGSGTNKAAGIISIGNGWYRCYATLTATAAATYHYIMAATGDNGVAFDGLTQDSLYIFGAQLETGNYPSSYIPTTTTAVTRSADLLRYKMDDGNMNTARGSLECNVLLPNIDNLLAPNVWVISAGSTNRMQVSATSAGNDFGSIYIYNGSVQANVASTTDIWNNAWNKLRGIWGPNDARILINSVSEGTQDVSVTVPSDMSQLDVGTGASAGYELNGLIAKLRLLGKGSTRG